MKGDYRGVADIIPVDIPVNMIIAAAWYTAVTKPSSCLIYHSTTGSVNPFTWGELGQLLLPFNLKPNTLTFLLFTYIYWIYHLKIFIEINAKLKIFVYYFSFLHTPSDKLNWCYAHYMNNQQMWELNFKRSVVFASSRDISYYFLGFFFSFLHKFFFENWWILFKLFFRGSCNEFLEESASWFLL